MSAKLIPQKVRMLLKRFFYRNSVYVSQAGQDFWVYGEAFNEKKHGFFLDIGAHDGIQISNTFLLEHKYSWSGICIEANPHTFTLLKQNRSAKCLNICLDSAEGEVDFALRDVMGGITGLDNKGSDINANNIVRLSTVPLIKVLSDNDAPSIIDYLSIDVEGAEERILADFDFQKYMFRCITIERPSKILRNLFKENGYFLIKEIPGLDCFYVHNDFLDEYMKNLFMFFNKKFLRMRWR